MGSTWDTIDRYVVISSDTHAGAELREYKAYLEPRWHDEFEAWAAAYSSPYDDLVDATAARNWDSDRRRTDLEADGVVAEVVFPNTIPPFFDTIHSFASLPWTRDDFERRLAGLRAHNRWLVDFCGRAPKQRRGLLQILPHDLDIAIEEIRWAKETGVIAGVLAPAIPPNHAVEPWFHTRYEPLWAVLEELDLPFGQHPGTGGPDVGKDQPAAPAVMLVEFTWWTRRTLAHLILAGVFERYPNLKAVWTEQGIGWVLQDLGLLDYTVADMKRSADNRTTTLFGTDVIESLSLKPSEYFARNCYLGASFMARGEVKYRRYFGDDQIMWGTDFPHEEGTTPYTREALRAAFHDVPEPELRRILGGNAAGVYGFDLEALAPLAARFGPTVAEVATPLGEVPPSKSPAFIGAGR
ncbi:MAG: amidohydrolase [Actinobacteria bacterium]|nr:amidohydrolase [Actinomycetota bacterium]